MASITPGDSVKHGKRRVKFSVNGRRHAIRFPACSWSSAIAIKHRIEDLVADKRAGTGLKPDTIAWLADLGDDLHKRLAATGLVQPRASSLLGEFLASYIEERTDVAESTKRKWNSTHQSLLDFFGEKKSLREITPGDADTWRRKLGGGKHLSENTRRKHTAVAKVFFNAARKKRLIESNPFEHLAATIVSNPNRFRFITPAEAEQVLEACPDSEWRLLFALSRYGGLRCPSESLALQWQDVDWERSRIRVRSSKTAHHVGKDSRLVPIFPELLPYLREAYELAPEGAVYCIHRYRGNETNLRTQLKRIIERAGVDPWPKLFQNLRSTRQTELQETFPTHVVCSWLGNTKAVAQEHYLQVTEEHFERAKGAGVAPSVAHAPKELGCTEYRADRETPRKQGACKMVQHPASAKMTPTGIEHPQDSRGKTELSGGGGPVLSPPLIQVLEKDVRTLSLEDLTGILQEAIDEIRALGAEAQPSTFCKLQIVNDEIQIRFNR